MLQIKAYMQLKSLGTFLRQNLFKISSYWYEDESQNKKKKRKMIWDYYKMMIYNPWIAHVSPKAYFQWSP